MDSEGGLTKFFWTNGVKDELFQKDKIEKCKKLEELGFGVFGDKVILPDGREFTLIQIESYFINKKAGSPMFSSSNPKDMEMHNARMYLTHYFEYQALLNEEAISI